MPGHDDWLRIGTLIFKQLGTVIGGLAREQPGIALIAVLALAALGGLLLAGILRLLRALLPWLVLAGTAFICWQTGLLQQCWHWLAATVR